MTRLATVIGWAVEQRVWTRDLDESASSDDVAAAVADGVVALLEQAELYGMLRGGFDAQITDLPELSELCEDAEIRVPEGVRLDHVAHRRAWWRLPVAFHVREPSRPRQGRGPADRP